MSLCNLEHGSSAAQQFLGCFMLGMGTMQGQEAGPPSLPAQPSALLLAHLSLGGAISARSWLQASC